MPSSTDDDDVIEIGDDGTFNIPSPPKNRAPVASKLDYIPPPTSQINKEEEVFVPPQLNLCDEILQKIEPGHYRLYLDKHSKQYFIVVHMLSSEKPEVKAYQSHITIGSNASDKDILKVDISKLHVDVKTTHVQHWNDFITIRLSK